MALMLLHRAEAPRLTFKIGGVMGDPERRCGDRITIDDTAIMSASHDAFITGISWRYDSAGFTQDLEAVDAASLYPTLTVTAISCWAPTKSALAPCPHTCSTEASIMAFPGVPADLTDGNVLSASWLNQLADCAAYLQGIGRRRTSAFGAMA